MKWPLAIDTTNNPNSNKSPRVRQPDEIFAELRTCFVDHSRCSVCYNLCWNIYFAHIFAAICALHSAGSNCQNPNVPIFCLIKAQLLS